MSTAGQVPVGSIEGLRFARLLAQLWEQGFTGSFRARVESRTGEAVLREILFERGRVAWAASDDGEDSIRTHLLQRGHLSAEQWRLAEERSGSAQVRRTLLDLGFLSARELQNADRERVTGIVLALFMSRDGEYAVDPGPPPHGTPNLKIDPRDLVLEGLMSSGDREQVLCEIGSTDAVLVVRPDDLVRASLSLPVELVGLMGKADGTRTVAEICALSPLPDFLISAAFAGLKALGLARPVEGSPVAAPPEPPKPDPGKPRRRSTGSRAARRVAELQTPMLPLEADTSAATHSPSGSEGTGEGSDRTAAGAEEEDDSGTVPLRSVHHAPAELADEMTRAPAEAASAPAEDEDDSGTVPVRHFADPSSDREEEALLSEGGSVSEHRDPQEEEEDDSGTVPVKSVSEISEDPEQDYRTQAMEATPGGSRRIRSEPEDEAPAASSVRPTGESRAVAPPPEDDSEDGPVDRETEVELKPGIPVDEAEAGHEPGPADPFESDEIEDAIQALEAPTPSTGDIESPQPPFALGDGENEEAPRAVTERAEGSDEESWPIQTDEQSEESFEEADGSGDENPSWIYQPSGEPPRQRTPLTRWPIWTGVAVAVVAIGAGLMFMFGDDDAGASDDTALLQSSLAAGPPADLHLPAANEAQEKQAEEPPRTGPLATASLAEGPATASATRKAASDTTLRPATGGPEATAPPSGGSKAPSAEEGQPLDFRSSGDIFQSGPFREAKALLARGDLSDAAGRFESVMASRKGMYTIQLALACEPRTVTRAVQTTRGSTELFILPREYNGRSCYRLLWGTYPSRSAAERARASVPRAFLKDKNGPFPAPI
jgi:hypothetical protein